MADGCRYSFFQHRECEYFPCHGVEDQEDFNCLFCYCPLYALGSRCGGSYSYTDDGRKDCSMCTLPHLRDNYGKVTRRLDELYGKTD